MPLNKYLGYRREVSLGTSALRQEPSIQIPLANLYTIAASSAQRQQFHVVFQVVSLARMCDRLVVSHNLVKNVLRDDTYNLYYTSTYRNILGNHSTATRADDHLVCV